VVKYHRSWRFWRGSGQVPKAVRTGSGYVPSKLEVRRDSGYFLSVLSSLGTPLAWPDLREFVPGPGFTGQPSCFCWCHVLFQCLLDPPGIPDPAGITARRDR
jgi:hypothetical protein